jgi:hypothetical protein
MMIFLPNDGIKACGKENKGAILNYSYRVTGTGVQNHRR